MRSAQVIPRNNGVSIFLGGGAMSFVGGALPPLFDPPLTTPMPVTFLLRARPELGFPVLRSETLHHQPPKKQLLFSKRFFFNYCLKI